jgi:CheY-like chemotaxis protein
MKVLLVDDSGLARRRTRQMLEGEGYEVIEAEDGVVALERYFVDKPDLVMLDLVMRGMYGLDVLRTASSWSRPTCRSRPSRWCRPRVRARSW